MIDLVLFDLDGVLVDACEWHYEALNEALRLVCDTEISREEHLSKFNGLTTRNKLNILGIDGDRAEKVFEIKQNITKKTISANSEPLLDKINLHTHLKNSGVKICCVTNCIRETAELMLKVTGQLEYMDMIITNEDVVRNKPFPDCYNLALDKFASTSKCPLIVEDSQTGILAARASGVKNIWEVENSSFVNIENYKRYLDENINTNGG